MKAMAGITLAVAALVLSVTQTASASQTAGRTICGPDMSLLLWPEGYRAHPLPTFEMFRGLDGPYGVANHLGTQSATRVAVQASVLDQSCAAYPGTTSMSRSLIGPKATGATRLACTFPAPPVVFTDLRHGSIRIRLVLPSGALVAQATVTVHGSALAYASRYCVPRHLTITPRI